MIRTLRRRHYRVWRALAFLTPLLLLVALWARRPETGWNRLPPSVSAAGERP